MAMEFDGVKFFSTKEVAERLQVSASTVRVYIRTAKLKGKRIGNSFKVSENSIREFLEIENVESTK